MIYLSYGMPKSASTFCYQLAESMLRQAGHIREEICKKFLPESFHSAFMTLNHDEIVQIDHYLPFDKILIIKTHAKLSKSINHLLDSGRIKASATFRDPRDAAISLVDAGENDRKLNKFRKFNEINDLEDAFLVYKYAKYNFIQWLTHTNVLKISFNLLALDPIEAALRIRNYLDIDVDVTPIVAKYSENPKKKIWEFNIGKVGRYKEYMSETQKKKFFSEFKDLIFIMNLLDDRFKI